MPWLKWVVVVLAVVEFGWLAFDGGRALIVGDYVTAASRQHAGELGPWARVVSAVGIEPRSTLMKMIHLVLGLTALVITACFAMGLPWAWPAMLLVRGPRTLVLSLSFAHQAELALAHPRSHVNGLESRRVGGPCLVHNLRLT